MHCSGHFSYHITNLFFKTMWILIEKVMSCISVRIRKGKLQGIKLLAKDVKYKPNLEKLLKSHIGYIDFKHIRISPDYHQQMQKHILAMIWQLGPPTFFLTFTSAEKNWQPLTNTLLKFYKTTENETNNTKENGYDICDIDHLVCKDPITCARYYRHRVQQLRKLIFTNHLFFGKINDFFSVTKL